MSPSTAPAPDPDRVPPRPGLPRLTRRLIPAAHPLVAAAVLVVASLVVAGTVWYPYDVQVCFLPWGRESGGWRPWDVYNARNPECNYPPFCLYLLTAVEALRLLLRLDILSTGAVVLMKVPFILAHALGALVCYYELRRPLGGKAARRIAVLYALCTALYVNAAQWGQADALVCLAMVAAVALLVNERPVLAGAAMGWALSIKLQAVVIAPVLLAYCLRRYGGRKTVLGVAAGFGTLALICLPFVLAGSGKPLLKSYTEASGYFPLRTLNAMNLWGAWGEFERPRHPGWTGEVLNDDRRAAFAALPGLSAHAFGLLLLGAHQVVLLVHLWRRPSRDQFLLACGLAALGFFVLPTQMHERYVVPAAALLCLSAVRSVPLLLLFLCVSALATWNQGLVLLANYLPYAKRSPEFSNLLYGRTFFWASLSSCALLLWGTALYLWRPLPPAPSPEGKGEKEGLRANLTGLR